ncbi:MAG: hypothetical protein U0V48_03800 [Anaerolineales bacterium]
MKSELASEEYCYLTTTGRVTGNPHEIEIWFGMKGDSLYLLSERRAQIGLGEEPDEESQRHRADRTTPLHRDGQAGSVCGRWNPPPDPPRRQIQRTRSDGSLSEWAQSALVVAIDIRRSPKSDDLEIRFTTQLFAVVFGEMSEGQRGQKSACYNPGT